MGNPDRVLPRPGLLVSVALVMLAMTAGGLMAVQGGINNTLRSIIGAPVGAALISFLVGNVLLIAMMFLTGEGIPGQDALASVPWWAYSGGAWGSISVAGSILLVQRLGASTTVAVNIAGQMLMSLVLDEEGWLGVPQRDLSPERILGALVVMLGAVLIAWQGARRPLRSTATTSPDDGLAAVEREPMLPRVLGLIAGVGIGAVLPTQAAINSRLRGDLDAPFTASAISFGGGTIILIVAVIVFAQQRPQPALMRRVPAWAWLGGVCGAIYVASSVILVPEFGAAVTIALVVVGQNVVSLALDHFGWLRLPRRPATIRRVVGVVLLLVGVSLVQLS